MSMGKAFHSLGAATGADDEWVEEMNPPGES